MPDGLDAGEVLRRKIWTGREALLLRVKAAFQNGNCMTVGGNTQVAVP
jgi:hypothetical protein